MHFNKSLFKIILKILVIPLSIVGFILYIHYGLTWKVFLEYFNSIKIRYLICAIGCVSLCLLLDHSCYVILRHHYQKKFPFWWETHACLRAQFWEMITPGTFAVGPIIHSNCMEKQGVDVSKSATIILIRQIIFTIVIAFLSLVFLGFCITFFINKMTPILWVLYFIALIMHTVTVIIYFLVPRKSKFLLKIVKGIVTFLYTIRLIPKKKLNSIITKSEVQINELKENMSKLDFPLWMWFVCIVLTIIHLISNYTIQYFIAKMLGVNIHGSYILVISAVSMLSAITPIIPIPGGLGTNDLAYVQIFIPVFGVNFSEIMMIFSRIITYYYPLLLGAIMLAIKTPRIKTESIPIQDENEIVNISKSSNTD